jgi:uncharacterized protein (TIGR02996 family)
MATHEGFLDAILDDPDDATPRLVYADWLDENGEPDRAEFIRVQCQFAELGEGEPSSTPLMFLHRRASLHLHSDPLHEELFRREHALLERHRGAWWGPLSRLAGAAFHRGFIEEIQLPALQFVQEAGALFRLAPVRHVHFDVINFSESSQRTHDHLPQLVDSPHLGHLRSIIIGVGGAHGGGISNHLRTEDVHRLVSSPHLGRLTILVLRAGLGPAAAEVLAAAPALAGLTTLDLGWDNALGDEGTTALAASPALTRLVRLDLSHNQIGPRGAAALATAPLGCLTRLALANNPLGDEGVAALAASPRLASLQELRLPDAGIDTEGVRALVTSPSLAGLKTLDLSGQWLGDDALKVLVDAAPHFGLTALDVSANDFSARALAELARSPLLGRLGALALNFSRHLSLEAVRALASSPHLAGLTTLHLGSCHLDDAAAASLAASPHLGGLSLLYLGHNAISASGARALAAALHRQRGCRLFLVGNHVEEAEMEALRAEYGDRVWIA